MPRSPSRVGVVAFAACLTLAAGWLVSPPAAADARVPLGKNGQAVPAGATELAAVGGDRKVALAIALRPYDQMGLDRFVAAVTNPRSPAYRHYLTAAQYNGYFAPRQSDVDRVRDYLVANGFRVTGVAGNRQVVDVAGTADQVRAAFGTTLRDYRSKDGKSFYANDSAPSVPASLAGVVRAVAGLTDLPAAHRASAPAGPTGPAGGYTPAQFRTAYNMKSLSSSYNGSGQTVGLIEFDAFKQSDIDAWTKYFGQPSVTPTVVPVDGGKPSPGSDQLEVTLDVEAVAATGPGATQVVYEAPNSDNAWVDEMARIASDNTISILSGSWLNGEICESDPIQASHDSYTQMAAQGITMLSASGDWGAYGCGYQGDNSTVQADFPPSDPLFTGVGGTQLRTADNAGTYQSESCWNQGSTGNTRSGGGYSRIYDRPDWQPGTNAHRSVPDVALDADYGAGALSVYMNGGWQDVGGTSLSSPLWAGYVAMVNQKSKAGGKGNVGAMNPTIYSVAQSSQYSSTFRDVTSGGNGTYNAGTGYDLCTGWGSPQGDNLADPLINGGAPAPANDFSIAADPASVSVDPGKSVTSTVKTTVTKGSAQSVALTASGLPTGVTATFSPTSVTAGQSSTLTLAAASSATPGNSSVKINGKTTDASHDASIAFTVNGTGPGDFSISVDPASASVTAGQSTSTTVKTTAAGTAAHPSVVGGDPTTVDQYPFIISMRRQGSVFPGAQSCTMTLMGPHTVLGAAHCLKEKDGEKWFVYGATNLNDTGFRADIKDSWVDPDYSSWQTGHDVAVITLDRDVPVPAGISYPTIATDTSLNNPGTMGRAIGWGKTGADTYSDVLRTAEMPVADDSGCANQTDLRTYYRTDGSMLCVGYADGHKGVCVGDSGSPFLVGNQIIGLFSWMSNACNTYGVYARVTTYASEIKAHLPGGSDPGGAVVLSASGLPSGATATFDPSSVNVGGTAKLTIGTAASTPAGTYDVTITGKSSSVTRTAKLTLTVRSGSPGGQVTVTNPGFQFTQHGQPASLALHATGGTGAYTWSVSGLPPGLSVTPGTGVISGTPTTTGNYQPTVTATDSAGGRGTASFGWFVY